ncbi:MAG TPA: M1 family peptidase, partial [Planctomycetota bacterium]|nr:M1 family peptidase [Planctomycetota bacterium]
QALYLERKHGRAAYLAEMMSKNATMNRTALAPREHKNSQEIYFGASGNDIYNKGSWVLHTLRWQLGDDQLFACLRRFCYPDAVHKQATDGSQVRLVDTDDFVKLCSEITGEDLAWFFEVYVRQPHLPKLQSELKDGLLSLHWETPGDLPFPLPVPVEVGGKTTRVAMPAGKGELRVGSAEYKLDPERLVLMDRPRRERR